MIQTLMHAYDTHRSQRERILALLLAKGYVYTKELVNAGIYQYNARIKELRELGYEIVSTKINNQFSFVKK